MEKLLKYRGYYGSLEASTEDNCLFGMLQFVRALVSYEGETVAELEAAFREAVDDYLATCEQLGEAPETPCKGSFNVRVGHDLHLAAAVSASRHGISLNDLTRQALNDYLQQHP
ncbi:type II toxin-antitoxin system HicB family antitoxin [Chromohalobacter sp. HP20-39]|uniref:type II toxin-antitoxin system HicB family antitoxin n=1 Tax=Chromohalobacter sp. HP20-39 TaxID=3079306 RepID=UPI00294B77FD|nr:type II toxin-antitoxin system HicB family antitoxin [Chromohalobacter sp. HP20-39]MDV6320563.1 type II toxin-antitoxin system HicB family antitoxin [Chromohalobacter sp. HP20-39]